MVDTQDMSPIALQEKERVQQVREIMNKGAKVPHRPINNTQSTQGITLAFFPNQPG
jgi:hypothetical protein